MKGLWIGVVRGVRGAKFDNRALKRVVGRFAKDSMSIVGIV
jgi:hypothetical protein